MASSSRATGLFTVDYVVSIGGTDDHESREMVHMLNLLTSFWGNEAIGYMEKFLNLVKSKTDELSMTLQSQGPAVRHETSGVAEPKKIRVLELEKKEILLRLKESEDKVESLQHTLKNAQEKYTELEKQTRVPKEKGILNMFAASYTKKCIELDNLRDEAVRHSIWFNEQTNASMAAKLDLEKNLSMKEHRIKELQTHKIEESEEKSPTNGVDDLLKVIWNDLLLPRDQLTFTLLESGFLDATGLNKHELPDSYAQWRIGVVGYGLHELEEARRQSPRSIVSLVQNSILKGSIYPGQRIADQTDVQYPEQDGLQLQTSIHDSVQDESRGERLVRFEHLRSDDGCLHHVLHAAESKGTSRENDRTTNGSRR